MSRFLSGQNIESSVLWHIPPLLIVGTYLPAGILGAYLFRDAYALSFLALLGMCSVSYYTLYPIFSRIIKGAPLRLTFLRLGRGINWRILGWTAVTVYVATITITVATTEVTPLVAALKGANPVEVAEARAEFLVNRQGPEVLLRYLAVILGRSVMPFLVTYLYWSGSRMRHAALGGLLLCYGVSLEKASALFAFLPLILLRTSERCWSAVLCHALILLACLSLWTFLAMGGVHELFRAHGYTMESPIEFQAEVVSPPLASDVTHHADRTRHWMFGLLADLHLFPNVEAPQPLTMHFLNRAIWIPYATAYDWLRFQHEVLDDRLTLGRSIGIVSWLMGEPRLQLEQQVYAYEFGASPGQAGASNTVFFVDAKLAFGWLGAIMYCMAFPFLAAAIFSSDNAVAKIASITSFFTASVSSLTATLLSGGLFFFIAISLLIRLDLRPSNDSLPRSVPSADS
jgi:hypothetical protein